MAATPGLPPRIVKETQRLLAEPVENFVVVPNKHNPRHFYAVLLGPPGSPYQGGKFQIEIFLPAEYPLVPLKARFISKIYVSAVLLLLWSVVFRAPPTDAFLSRAPCAVRRAPCPVRRSPFASPAAACVAARARWLKVFPRGAGLTRVADPNIDKLGVSRRARRPPPSLPRD